MDQNYKFIDFNSVKEPDTISPYFPESGTWIPPSENNNTRQPSKRFTYQRVPSSQELEQDTSYHPVDSPHDHRDGTGLGIQGSAAKGPSIEISLSEESTPAVPDSAKFTLSPTSTKFGSTKFGKKSYQSLSAASDEEADQQRPGHSRSRSDSSFIPFTPDSERHRLWHKGSSSTLSPAGPTDGKHQDFTCTTRRHFHRPRAEFPSIIVLIASAFSTIFSGIWLGLATSRPHYGQTITNNSRLPPATASLLIAAFAKAIELTFVTTFVTFLGQILSQRAFRKNSEGITVAQMQMRMWILQPGTLLTHFAAVRYAAISLLGGIALLAAIAAMLYTTASDALVSPKLRFGEVHHKTLFGQVSTTFANQTYIQDHCATPIPPEEDPLHGAQTCIAIEHSGQAYHNYAQYLTNWNHALAQGNVSTNMTTRPVPVGTLYDNTTVQGSWIDVQDMADNSKVFKRIINNVSLAMPHAGVYAAAYDKRNAIIQPADLDGLGEYYIEASVPSPAVNVLCAAMTAEELTPMVASKWPAYASQEFNASAYPAGYDIPVYPSWMNSTAVDGVFGFGEKYGRRPPTFGKLPIAYNTLLNFSNTPIQDDSLYVLAADPDTNYMLCSLRASLSPECSTQLHNTMSGGAIQTHCEDTDNRLTYSKSHPEAKSGIYIQNWRDVAAQWAIALSLNAGINDGQASNARLLSQLIPTQPSLDPKLPSIAEGLAVLAGCTLLLSAHDTPFIHYWNYTTPGALPESQYQQFNASLRVVDYSSGGIQRWQNMFYIVLTAVFLLNVLCICYFIIHTGLVTDFMEPQNLFALSLNSPPSRVLEGTCGGGPEGEQYRSTWHIWMNRFQHFYIESTDRPLTQKEKTWGDRTVGRSTGVENIEMDGSKSPVGEMYDRLSVKRGSWL